MTKLATRLAFLAVGFTMACWAPLVPYAKIRVGVDDGQLGLILLCLGIGSVLAMPLTGWLSARFGSKPLIVGGGAGIALLLPLLSIAPDAVTLALALFGFGASLGTLDVAMNVHAVDVEKTAGRPLMSGFHAMFSVGGFIGSGAMTALLTWDTPPFAGALSCATLTMAMVALASPRLMPARGQPTPLVVPRGIVLLLAALGAVTFLVEGALLDWSALLVVDIKLANTAQGGLGYMLFSIAMTFGRLVGDRVVARFGNHRVLTWGGAVTVAGLALLLSAPIAPIAMAGFLLIGLGASNIVPVLFRLTGQQKVMPVGPAVGALTTTGYTVILAGPAGIGFVAHASSLRVAFWLLAGLMCLVPIFAAYVAKATEEGETTLRT